MINSVCLYRFTQNTLYFILQEKSLKISSTFIFLYKWHRFISFLIKNIFVTIIKNVHYNILEYVTKKVSTDFSRQNVEFICSLTYRKHGKFEWSKRRFQWSKRIRFIRDRHRTNESSRCNVASPKKVAVILFKAILSRYWFWRCPRDRDA